jgi:hypothetical protein
MKCTGLLRSWDDKHGFGFAVLGDGTEVFIPTRSFGYGFRPVVEKEVVLHMVTDTALAVYFNTVLRADLCYSASGGEFHPSDDEMDDEELLQACLRAEAGFAAADGQP